MGTWSTGASPRPVCVVVVTHNSARHVGALLESIGASETDRTVETVVVDCGSTDGTPALLEGAGVRWLPAGGNLGYSAGINLAVRQARPDAHIVVLNPDLVLRPDAIEQLARALDDDPRVGVAVPRLEDPSGGLTPHLRNEPSILGSLGDAVWGAHWRSRPRMLTDGWLRPADYDCDRDVGWAGGAALAISPSCASAVGEWNSERYFLYAEETDFQRRVRNAGYTVRYVSAATAVHAGGGSGQSAQLSALMAVNRWRYFRSFHGAGAAGSYWAVLNLEQLLRLHQAGHRLALQALTSTRVREGLPGPTYVDASLHRAPCSPQPPRLTLCLHGVGRPARESLEPGEDDYWIDQDTLDGILDVVAARDDVEITVDDANASDVEIILPALQARGLRATFFVITDRIGTSGSLTAEQIRELDAAGMGIGTHGATHQPWRELSGPALTAELRASTSALATITGKQVRYAACPLGSYDRSVLSLLRSFGFERVYTVDGAASRPEAWIRSRYTVTRFDTADSIAQLLASPRGTVGARTARELKNAVKRWR